MRRASFLRGFVLGFVVLIGLWALPGEAQGPPAPSQASLEQLKERVLAYWQARVRKDYRAEYDLLEPRARARLNPDEYGRGRIVEYLAVQVEGVERRGNFARADVRLVVKVIHPLTGPGGRTDSTVLRDHWVLIHGVWYRSDEADMGAPTPWPMAAN